MTKREMLNKIATLCSNDAEIVAFCGHEIELLDRKKNHKSDKPTKKQVENAELIAKIVAFVGEKGVVTCGDVENAFGISNQKASALLRQATGLTKTEAKGKQKATWAIAE